MLLAFPLAASSWGATVVWNGTPIAFSKDAFANFALAGNQDRITNQVWLTRGTSQGLFNIFAEPSYTHSVSPSGTEWAYGTTANYATLSYTDWETWTGGTGGGPPSTVGKDAVLHLTNEDIYLDIKMTSWGGSGGQFSYIRSTAAVPEPGSIALLGIGTILLSSRRRNLTSARFAMQPVAVPVAAARMTTTHLAPPSLLG